jgi:hypothetical protein
MKTIKKEVAVQEIRTNIIEALKERYGMSIYSFSKSELPQKWGIELKPASIANVLSTGNVSFDTFNKLYRNLNLGDLSKEEVVTKETKYFI